MHWCLRGEMSRVVRLDCSDKNSKILAPPFFSLFDTNTRRDENLNTFVFVGFAMSVTSWMTIIDANVEFYTRKRLLVCVSRAKQWSSQVTAPRDQPDSIIPPPTLPINRAPAPLNTCRPRHHRMENVRTIRPTRPHQNSLLNK